MSFFADLEGELNKLCERYAQIQESAEGRRLNLKAFQHEATLEAIGNKKKSSRETQHLEENTVASVLHKLRDDTDSFNSYTMETTVVVSASSVNNRQRLQVVRTRLAELLKLVRRAIGRLTLRRGATCSVSKSSEEARKQKPAISDDDHVGDPAGRYAFSLMDTKTSPFIDLVDISSSDSDSASEEPDGKGGHVEVVDLVASTTNSSDESSVIEYVKTKTPPAPAVIDLMDSSDGEGSFSGSVESTERLSGPKRKEDAPTGEAMGDKTKRLNLDNESRVEQSTKPAKRAEKATSNFRTESGKESRASSCSTDATRCSAAKRSKPATTPESGTYAKTKKRKRDHTSVAANNNRTKKQKHIRKDPARAGKPKPPPSSCLPCVIPPSALKKPPATSKPNSDTRPARLAEQSAQSRVGQQSADKERASSYGASTPRRPATSIDPHSIPVFADRTASHRAVTNAGSVQEPHKKIVYDAAWSNDYSLDDKRQVVTRYLATCGHTFATVYEVKLEDGLRGAVSSPFRVKACFVDDDDDFYTCAFAGRSDPNVTTGMTRSRGRSSRSMHLPQLLCVGGLQQHIHVIDMLRRKRIFTLRGHGGDVLDLKPSPVDEWILLSCSLDESIRLWNLKSGAPVAILTGRQGHREHVVSVSWHLSGTRIASSGMDNTIKVWDTDTGSAVQKAITASHEAHRKAQRSKKQCHVQPTIVHTPIFSTNKLHMHCVDCVEFVGNLILSKSVDSVVELWYPVLTRDDEQDDKMQPLGRFKLLRSYEYKKGDIWYMQFATDPMQTRIAVGNIEGRVFLFDISAKSTQPVRTMLPGNKVSSPVRGLRFSPCGNVLVATLGNGMVYKWDVRRKR